MKDPAILNGPWHLCDMTNTVYVENAKIGGMAKIIDIRGWGYMTGQGHGALGMDHESAGELQDKLGIQVSALPDLLSSIKSLALWARDEVGADPELTPGLSEALSAITKATGESL